MVRINGVFQPRTIWNRRPTKYKLSVRRRCFAISANDVTRSKDSLSKMEIVIKALKVAELIDDIKFREECLQKLRVILAYLGYSWYQLVKPPQGLNDPLTKIHRRNSYIDKYSPEECSSNFRFRDAAQLRRLYTVFRFPRFLRTPCRHVFSGEEVLLVGLYRLHAPNVEGDGAWMEENTRIEVPNS